MLKAMSEKYIDEEGRLIDETRMGQSEKPPPARPYQRNYVKPVEPKNLLSLEQYVFKKFEKGACKPSDFGWYIRERFGRNGLKELFERWKQQKGETNAKMDR